MRAEAARALADVHAERVGAKERATQAARLLEDRRKTLAADLANRCLGFATWNFDAAAMQKLEDAVTRAVQRRSGIRTIPVPDFFGSVARGSMLAANPWLRGPRIRP